ncbi:MAG: 3D domain-containing protein [Kofleriaceae bacterium]
MRAPGLPLLLLVVACGGAATGPDATDDVDAGAPDGAGVDAPPRPDPGPVRGSFALTYYWVTAEADFAGAADTALYSPGCAALATVPRGFADSLAVEGTGRLRDGRLLNVDGPCGCPASPCFVEAPADHAWGTGVMDRPLVPYRSIAVDPRVVPYGTTLWLAELDGVAVPGPAPWGGFVHDGCVVAADTGGAIVGQHLDWFVGERASYRTLDGTLGLAAVTVHDGGARCP